MKQSIIFPYIPSSSADASNKRTGKRGWREDGDTISRAESSGVVLTSIKKTGDLFSGRVKSVFLAIQSVRLQGIRGWARRLLGNKDGLQWRAERERVLISRGIGLIVLDSLCNRARDQNAAVVCFYFDFTA